MQGICPIKRKENDWSSSDSKGDDPLTFKRQKDAEEGEKERESSSVSSFSNPLILVVIGQMSIPLERVKLYNRLINNFGEIVSPNLPKYKLGLINTALTDLLNVVREIIVTTPKDVSEEKVLEWEDMVSFYSGMGLKVNWLIVRVKCYSDWLVRRSKVDMNQMECKIMAKRKELEAKRKEVSLLENELDDLWDELKTERSAQSQFDFSFFDK